MAMTTTITTTMTKAVAVAMTTITATDDEDNKDGGYGGRDGHRMRKGRRHDNETIHNNKIGKR